MRLTNSSAATHPLPPGKSEAIIFDDEVPGLGIRIRRGGSRMWVFQYKLGAKQRRLTLGSVKALDAREVRTEAKKLHAKVRLGGDPAGDKAEGRVRAAETFGAALGRFLTRQKARLKPRSYAEVERHLVVQAKPLHGLRLAKIERRTIAGRLAELAEASGPVAADRARTSISAFFAWAIREGLAESNPVIETNKASGDVQRDRILTDEELRAVWAALQDDQYGAIVRLLILTGQRRDEIASLRWSETDLDRGTILLPPERTKNHRPHEVPLSGPARAILEAQPRRANGDGTPRDLIFGKGQGGFSGWSGAKEALDARILETRRAQAKKADAKKIQPLPHWTLHDLRRTAATRMVDLGVQLHVVEAVLNHVSGHKAGVAGIYNRATYTAEKKMALNMWADRVMTLVEGRESKVVPLRAVP
jgi:integrase